MARRKRKDPDQAPIDGDYTRDVVLNKSADKAYALVHQDDMAVMSGRGYRRTARTEDGTGARPAYDQGGDGDMVVGGQLVLMEAPVERAEAVQKRSEKQFGERATGLRESIEQYVAANPGSKFTRGYRATA
jgi:hypothetical protein